ALGRQPAGLAKRDQTHQRQDHRGRDQVAPAVEAQVARELAAANFRLLKWKELSDVDSHVVLLSRQLADRSRQSMCYLPPAASCLLLTRSAPLSFALLLRGFARASTSAASIGFLVMIWSRAGCSLP